MRFLIKMLKLKSKKKVMMMMDMNGFSKEGRIEEGCHTLKMNEQEL